MIVDPATLGPCPSDCKWPRRLRHRFGNALRDARHHLVLYTLVFAIWGLAFVRVFIHPTPRLPILFNWTASVPYKVTLLQVGHRQALRVGDFVVYTFDGEAQRMYPGLRAQPFFKQIRGVPGDRVTVVDRQLYVNGVPVGHAKAATFDRRPLHPLTATTIPPGYYYVQGTHPDSFDSRYQESGLVRADRVIGKVIPLF
ncbi:conjugative transfer signal peptidase TraF [Herbaspirillum sp. HC18]|nr:conjugative transfer signal peptidase TraF [Herbaspirillum sp. HC18]